MTIKTVCFTGHRPKDVYGYEDIDSWQRLRVATTNLVTYLANQGATTFISGGAQGADQTAFWAVAHAKRDGYALQNVVYLPYSDYGDVWRKGDLFGKDQLDQIRHMADRLEIVRPDVTKDSPRRDIVGALFARNDAMIQSADALIALAHANRDFTTSKGGTADTIRRAWKNHMPVYIVDVDTCNVYDATKH